MTRKLKALGLSLVAVFAMSALAASAAQADGVPDYFHADAEHIVLTGEEVEGKAGLQVFTPGPESESAVECEDASFEGTVKGTYHAPSESWTTAEHVKVKPLYGECSYGENSASVDTNDCHYELGPTTTEGPEEGKEHATVDVVDCTEPIEINVAGLLTLSIDNQQIPHAVRYEGESTAEHDITVKATAKNIDFTCSGALACFFAGIPTKGSTGTYDGDVTVKGYEYLDGETGEYEEGDTVAIWHGPTTP